MSQLPNVPASYSCNSSDSLLFEVLDLFDYLRFEEDGVDGVNWILFFLKKRLNILANIENCSSVKKSFELELDLEDVESFWSASNDVVFGSSSSTFGSLLNS